MSRRGWALFIAMCFIWGIPYLLIKVAVSDVSPVALVLFRTVIGSLILVPIALARGDVAPALRHWRWIVAYTAIEVALPWFLVSDAELPVQLADGAAGRGKPIRCSDPRPPHG